MTIEASADNHASCPPWGNPDAADAARERRLEAEILEHIRSRNLETAWRTLVWSWFDFFDVQRGLRWRSRMMEPGGIGLRIQRLRSPELYDWDDNEALPWDGPTEPRGREAGYLLADPSEQSEETSEQIRMRLWGY